MIIIKFKFEIEIKYLYTQTKHNIDVIMPVRLIINLIIFFI